MASDGILEALGKTYNPEILEATAEPKSAQELSETLDVPIATCYRRIEELTEAGLLELHDRPLSEDHRRVKVYRRNVDEVVVDFSDGIDIQVEERSEVKGKLDEVWRRVSKG